MSEWYICHCGGLRRGPADENTVCALCHRRGQFLYDTWGDDREKAEDAQRKEKSND